MTPEGELKAKCRKLAKKLGLIFWNIEGKGIGGIPDTICGMYPHGSGIIFIEFKRAGKEPFEQQIKRMSELVQSGQHAYWTDSFEGFCELIGYDADL